MDYYIYKLVDPRTGKPFYIGKGKGDRLHQHEKEARKGVHSRKCYLIRELWISGFEVDKQVVKRFSVEADAYAAEKALIEEIGLENLTNVVPGGVMLNPRVKQAKESKITFGELRKFAPTFARTLRILEDGKRIKLANYDITSAFYAFGKRLVIDFGFETVAKVLKPYGVILQPSRVA